MIELGQPAPLPLIQHGQVLQAQTAAARGLHLPVQCTVHSVQCTVYSVQCTVYSVQCTEYKLSVSHLFRTTGGKASLNPSSSNISSSSLQGSILWCSAVYLLFFPFTRCLFVCQSVCWSPSVATFFKCFFPSSLYRLQHKCSRN